MTPAAATLLSAARLKAMALTPRINNALIHAAHKSNNDARRIEYLQDALQKASEVAQAIQLAQAALMHGRRQGGES